MEEEVRSSLPFLPLQLLGAGGRASIGTGTTSPHSSLVPWCPALPASGGREEWRKGAKGLLTNRLPMWSLLVSIRLAHPAWWWGLLRTWRPTLLLQGMWGFCGGLSFLHSIRVSCHGRSSSCLVSSTLQLSPNIPSSYFSLIHFTPCSTNSLHNQTLDKLRNCPYLQFSLCDIVITLPGKILLKWCSGYPGWGIRA